MHDLALDTENGSRFFMKTQLVYDSLHQRFRDNWQKNPIFKKP